jgi:exodeoxyribonuclease V alpha subunit
MSYFSGRVHTIIFENDAQDFYILRMVLDDTSDGVESLFGDYEEHVVVRGNVPGMKPTVGTWLGFDGKWVNHDQYGRQVQIIRAPVIKEWTSQVAIAMLISNGVGGRVARRLASELGDKFVPALDDGDEALLADVDGVTTFMAAHALTTWKEIKSFHKTLDFLSDAGVPRRLISRIWGQFGDDAEKMLTENPWSLVGIDGITFPQADDVAKKMGLSLDNPHRRKGAVLFVCKTARGMGHIFMSSGEVRQAVQAYIPNIDPRGIAEALAACHKEKTLVLDRSTRPGLTAIYEPWLYRMEKECARLLKERMSNAAFSAGERQEYIKKLSTTGPLSEASYEADMNDLPGIARSALMDWGKGNQISLSDDQMQAAVNALIEPVSVLTGLPGTGKTTDLNFVVNVLRNAEIRVLLIAPTGIAAKRIKTVTGADAATIHRAFGARGFGGSSRESTYAGVVDKGDEEKTLGGDGSMEEWLCTTSHHPADVIICDESSMVDQHLLYRVLTCTKPTARLVFVGDAAQLPSVGPGNVLRELISSGRFPTVALTDIYRQEDTSDIVVAAHAIHKGDIPEVGRSKESDFVLLPIASEDEILSAVVKVSTKLFGRRENFQVLSPKHGGTLGVTSLNTKLREVLNPKQPGLHEMRLGAETIREGDRVMVVKNDYELGVFNGDIGKVNRLHRRDREVEVKIHGPPVMYVRIPFKKAARMLRLAYAMTIHKSQGQEYGIIIMPLVKSFAHQLQRNLVYTGITRAKKRVILLGHQGALVSATLNSTVDERNTLFRDRIQLALDEDDATS